MGLKRDLAILGIMIIILVSSTVAWQVNDQQFSMSVEAIDHVLGPVQVNTNAYVIQNYRGVDLSLTLQNTDASGQTITLEAQAVDQNGEIIADLIDTQSVSFSGLETKIVTISFDYEHIDKYIDDFLIVITGDGYILRMTADASGSTIATVAITGYSILNSLQPRAKFLTPPWTQNDMTDANWKIQQVRIAFNPNWKSRYEIIAVTLGTNVGNTSFEINAYVYNGIEWSLPTLLGTGAPYTAYPQARPFDVVYEGTSGRVMIAWTTGTANNPDGTKDISYQIWDGISWLPSTGYYNTGSGQEVFSYIRLEANPTTDSNQIGFAGLTRTNKEVKAMIWSGSAWGDLRTICPLAYPAAYDMYECFDIAYERKTGNFVVMSAAVVSTGVYRIRWNRYTSSGWGVENWFSMTPGTQTTVIYWLVLKAYNGKEGSPLDYTNRMMILALDRSGTTNRIYAKFYNAATMEATLRTIDSNGIEAYTTRCFDGDWEPNSVKFLCVYGDNNIDPITYRTWTTAGWSAASTFAVTGLLTDQRWVQVRSNPKGTAPIILVGVLDDADDITVLRWLGVSPWFQSEGEFTSSSSQAYEAFDIGLSFP